MIYGHVCHSVFFELSYSDLVKSGSSAHIADTSAHSTHFSKTSEIIESSDVFEQEFDSSGKYPAHVGQHHQQQRDPEESIDHSDGLTRSGFGWIVTIS